MLYAGLFKTGIDENRKILLLAHLKAPKLTVIVWKTKQEALEYFEGPYQNNHRRGFEASSSACIHWITFHPKIVEIENDDDVLKLVDPEQQLYTASSIAGTMEGLAVTDEATKLYDEKGIDVKLIRFEGE